MDDDLVLFVLRVRLNSGLTLAKPIFAELAVAIGASDRAVEWALIVRIFYRGAFHVAETHHLRPALTIASRAVSRMPVNIAA